MIVVYDSFTIIHIAGQIWKVSGSKAISHNSKDNICIDLKRMEYRRVKHVIIWTHKAREWGKEEGGGREGGKEDNYWKAMRTEEERGRTINIDIYLDS